MFSNVEESNLQHHLCQGLICNAGCGQCEFHVHTTLTVASSGGNVFICRIVQLYKKKKISSFSMAMGTVDGPMDES